MRKTLLTMAIAMTACSTYAQTNIFPTSGNVGIGTLSPAWSLDISADYPTVRLTSTNSTSPGAVIRGNLNTWIFGWSGLAGLEDLSIGTQDNSGSRTLTFAAGGYARMKILPNGNVGIGTLDPATLLHVAGTTQTNLISFTEGTNTIGYLGRGGSITGGFAALPDALGLTYFGRDFVIGGWSKTGHTWGGVSFYINSDNSNVGIGTTTPDAKLAVNGTIHAKEVKVDLTGWPDYVFKPEYQLPSLTEVKAYIGQNQHLPGMPSELEIVSNGVNLGEMNKLLVKKVEELTLYLIDKDNQLTNQQSQLCSQQQQINELKQLLTKSNK